jgi:hypothetical protein
MSRPDIHPKTQIDDSGNDGYRGKRLLIGTPTTGTVRMEWVASRYNQTVPTNWSKTDMIEYMSSFVPLRYTVHDAQNLIVQACLARRLRVASVNRTRHYAATGCPDALYGVHGQGGHPCSIRDCTSLRAYHRSRWFIEDVATTTSVNGR